MKATVLTDPRADDNRRLALRFQTLPLLLGKFKDNSLAKVAIPAAFNICNDFGKYPHVYTQWILTNRLCERCSNRGTSFHTLPEIIGERHLENNANFQLYLPLTRYST